MDSGIQGVEGEMGDSYKRNKRETVSKTGKTWV